MSMPITRRSFAQIALGIGVLALGSFGVIAARKALKRRIRFGVCTSLKAAPELKAAGFDFIEGGVADYLQPTKTDADFAPRLTELRASPLPPRSCNGFIPGTFRLTGPAADHAAALPYALAACRHADAAGISYIVFGSGGARRCPAGFPVAKARDQFIDFCRKLAAKIKDFKVTIVLEPLNKSETNLLNTVAEGIDYVDAIDSPRVQLLADYYHMQKANESPDSIRKAGSRIRHVHVAELADRMAPGTTGQSFKPLFDALRDIGYSGGVSCECGWPKTNRAEAYARALAALRAS